MHAPRSFYWLIIFVIIGGCKRIELQKQSPLVRAGQQASLLSAQAPLTIMLHGTARSCDMTWCCPPLHRWLLKNVRTPFGMLRLNNLAQDHMFAKIARVLNDEGPELFALNNFYFFGWSGKLSFEARKKAAEELYAEIKKLQAPARNMHLPIIIITHSHGGNVVLNLARVAEEHHDSTLRIERLILLACPVQDETEKYASRPIFKRVYNFYSTADWLQVLDPQSVYRERISYHRKRKKPCETLFSRRTFKKGSNVYQIEVQNCGNALWHKDFIKPQFHHVMPEMIRFIENKNLNNQTQWYQLDIGGCYE